MATTDIGRVTPIWRGFYSSATTYELNDIVIDTAGSVWWHKSEEQTTGVTPAVGDFWDAVIDMSIFSGLIQTAIVTAQTAVQAAQAAETGVAEDVQRAETAAGNAETYAQNAQTSAANVGAYAQAAEAAKNAAAGSAESAGSSATAAAGSKSDAEAYAVGKRGGTDVGVDDPTYHNNAKYYADQAGSSAEAADGSKSDAEAYAVGKRGGEDVGSEDPAYHNNAKYWSEQAEATAEDIEDSSAQIAQNAADVADLKTQLMYIPDLTNLEVSNGYIKGAIDGNYVSSDSYRCTDFVDIARSLHGTKLKCFCSLRSNAGIAFYKTNDVSGYISGISGTTAAESGYTADEAVRLFDIPNGAKYFRATLRAEDYTSASSFKIDFINLPGVDETVKRSIDNENTGKINAENIEKIKTGLVPQIEFENGAWGYVNGVIKKSANNYRIKSKKFYVPSQNERCLIGWRFRAYLYEGVSADGTTYSSGQWYTTDFTLTAGIRYAITIARVQDDEDTTETADILDFLSKITLDSYLSDAEKIVVRSLPKLIREIAHRGWTKGVPENTLPSFAKAAEKGFVYVETDVQFTSDDVPVLCHDYSIDRTSNGTGYIYALTYSELSAFDFNYLNGVENTMYKHTKIPTFTEFIKLCKWLGLKPYVELKAASGHAMTNAQLDILANVIASAGMENDITWIGGDVTALNYLISLFPNCRFGIVASTYGTVQVDWIAGKITNGIAAFYDLAYDQIDTTSIGYAKSKSVPVEAWTPSNAETVLALNDYVTGITVNNIFPSKIWADYYMRY